MSRNHWYVITGGPSTGKTTLLAELARRGYRTVQEAARTVIDDALARGITPQELRRDEKRFQEDVAAMKATTEASLDPQMVTFFDRGMHDTLAYMRYYSFDISESIEQLMNARCRAVFLLDPLPQYESDYARTEDEQFIAAIQQLLHDAYAEYDMTPIHIPAVSVDERINLILDHLKTE